MTERFEFPVDQSEALTSLGRVLVALRDDAVRDVDGMLDSIDEVPGTGTLRQSWTEAMAGTSDQASRTAHAKDVVRAVAPDIVDMAFVAVLDALDTGRLPLRAHDGTPMTEFGREQLAGWFFGWRAEAVTTRWNPAF